MMNEIEIEQVVKEIVAEILDADLEELSAETHFRKDLDADSIDLLELITELEKRFGGRIPDEEMRRITTIGEATTYIVTRQTGS